MSLLRQPLIRLLAVNLAAGMAVALLLLGGLLALNFGGLRELIRGDGAAAAILLGFGFIVTFGSAAMGSAVMMLGRERKRGGGKARARRRSIEQRHGPRPAARRLEIG